MEMLVDIAIPVVVIMMMFVVGLELSLEDFRRIQGYPKPVLVGTAGQLIILPLIAAVRIPGQRHRLQPTLTLPERLECTYLHPAVLSIG